VQRAILSGVNFLDERLGPSVTIAARAGLDKVDRFV
jgi:hypothetical protein